MRTRPSATDSVCPSSPPRCVGSLRSFPSSLAPAPPNNPTPKVNVRPVGPSGVGLPYGLPPSQTTRTRDSVRTQTGRSVVVEDWRRGSRHPPRNLWQDTRYRDGIHTLKTFLLADHRRALSVPRPLVDRRRPLPPLPLSLHGPRTYK